MPECQGGRSVRDSGKHVGVPWMSLPRAFNILCVDNGLLMKEWPAFETDELDAWRKTMNT